MNIDADKEGNSSKPASYLDGPLEGELKVNQSRGELLESLFAHVADAIFVVDPDGRIIDVNPAACAMLGYFREELLMMRPWDFVTSASREEIMDLMRGIKREVPVTVRRAFRRSNRKTRNQANYRASAPMGARS
jgi:PAS domain S-box-containing protein